MDSSSTSRPHKLCKILKEEEILKLQNDAISDVSNVLSVSRGAACTLLCRNNWSRTSVYDKWFSDETNFDPLPAPNQSPSSQICKICCEPEQNMLSAACGHPFCTDCWKTYIRLSIQDGPGCLTLTCPEPGCKTLPGLDMVDSLASAVDKTKYYRYLCRSYVESNPKTRKWCPAPGCDFAIENDISDDDNNQVTCDCGYKLCWGCGEESHSPVDCSTVAKWMEKNNSEAENTVWILAYTKPCPKCRRPIQKSHGCSHMTCGAPCYCSFCWICLTPVSEHVGYCNGYRAIEAGLPEESVRRKARKHLERYTHYYERWASNDKSRKIALASLRTARNEHVGKLIDTQMQSFSQIMFVVEAWEQVVECRRVLKWTYAYGYYLSESGSEKLEFFGHLQGQAETALERLHYCVEKEMVKYFLGCFAEDFNKFRIKLSGLTSVTKNYFENLVSALENDLSEVVIDVGGTKKRELIDESKTTQSSKKRRRRRRHGTT